MNKTRFASTRLTQEEHEVFLEAAARRGIPPADYFREQLLGSQDQIIKTLLAELREMRTILFEMIRAALNGRQLTDELVSAIVANAEATKFLKADKVLNKKTA